MVELEAPFLLHEGGQLDDPRVPLVRMRRTVVGRAWSPAPPPGTPRGNREAEGDEPAPHSAPRPSARVANGRRRGGGGGGQGARGRCGRDPHVWVRWGWRKQRRGHGRSRWQVESEAHDVLGLQVFFGGQETGSWPVRRLQPSEVGDEGDHGRGDVAEEEGHGGPVEAVAGTRIRAGPRMATESVAVMATVARGRCRTLASVRYTDVTAHGIAAATRRQDVGRRPVVLAVERDDEVAARASPWPPDDHQARPRRRWPGAPGSGGGRRPGRPRRAAPGRWPSARSRPGPRRPTPRRSWRCVGVDVDEDDHRQGEGRRLVGEGGGPVDAE